MKTNQKSKSLLDNIRDTGFVIGLVCLTLVTVRVLVFVVLPEILK